MLFRCDMTVAWLVYAGVYDDDAVEVLFDVPFGEGTDLHGRANGRVGGMLPTGDLLNISKPQAVAASGVTTNFSPSTSNSFLNRILPFPLHTLNVRMCLARC